ncbi:MAG: HAD family hydrolase [Burkholderiaceae bacterium]
MAKLELIVFDWDGTVMDSTAAIAMAIRGAAEDLGLRVPTLAQAAHVIGLGLSDALQQAVPDLKPDQIDAFTERYRVHYFASDPELMPFAGIPELLESLSAGPLPVAVATGKSRAGLNRVLDALDWRKHFISTRCADEGLPKPDPWMLNDLIEELGVSAQGTVMIGDTTHDLGMARAANVSAIAVTYGAHPDHVLKTEPSLAMVDDVAALEACLLGLQRDGLHG